VSGAPAALLGLLFALISCRSEAARRLEGESEALGRRIDAVRNAPNEAKPELLRALAAAACESAEACALRQLCVSAYTRHLAALEGSARARRLLAIPDGGTRASIDAARALAEADLALAESRQQSERCAAEQGALRRRARER